MSRNKKNNTGSSVNIQALEVLQDIGLNQIEDEIINSIWRGDELNDLERELLNGVCNRLSQHDLENILVWLKAEASSIQPAGIITTTIQEQQQIEKQRIEREELKKQQLAKKKEKSDKAKTKSNNNNKKNKRGGRKKSKGESDSEEEDDEEESSEEEEQEGEDQQMKDQEEETVNEQLKSMEQMNLECVNEQPNQFHEYIQRSGISTSHLSILLYWMITSDEFDKEIQVTTARVFLYMSTLTHRMFHPYTYRMVLKFLNSTPNIKVAIKSTSLGDDPFKDESSQKASTKQQQKKPIKKQTKKGKSSQGDDDEEMEDGDQEDQDEDEDDDDEDDGMEVDGRNSSSNNNNSVSQEKWIQLVTSLLSDMEFVLNRFSLSRFTESFVHTVEGVTSLARTIHFKKSKKKGEKASRQLVSPAELKMVTSAFSLLEVLSSGRHGALPDVLPIVLKEIVQSLTLTPKCMPVLPTVLPRHLIMDRDLAIEFVVKISKEILGSGGDLSPLVILLQHICVRIAEKADYRGHAVESVARIFIQSSITDNASLLHRFITFLVTYSKNIKNHYRQFAVEVSLSLLQNEAINELDSKLNDQLVNIQQQQQQPSPTNNNNTNNNNTVDNGLISRLLNILIQRSSDKVSLVRSKALSCLALLLQDLKTVQRLKSNLKQLFMGGGSHLISFLAKRSDDEKSGVRKSAIQVLEVLCLQMERESMCNREILTVLASHREDSSPLIRKQIIGTVTEFLNHFTSDTKVIQYWKAIVLPLVADREQTVQEKSLDSIQAMIFNPIVQQHESGNVGLTKTHYLWKLLDDIVNTDMTPYLHKCCQVMSMKKLITPQIIKSLQAMIKSDTKNDTLTSIGGWTLLAEIGYCCPDKLDHSLILGTYNYYIDKVFNNQTPKEEKVGAMLTNVLILLENISPYLNIKQANDLFKSLFLRVKKFTYLPTHVQLFISVLVHLTSRICKEEDGDDKLRLQNSIEKSIKEWTGEILEICDRGLGVYILPDENTLDDEDEDVKDVKEDEKDEQKEEKEEEEMKVDKKPKRIMPSIEMIGQFLFVIGEINQIGSQSNIIVMPSRIKTLVQALIAPNMAFKSTAKGKSSKLIGEGEVIPDSVRAHAFITLGKLCLGDDKLAKKCVATFAKELESSESPIIRNNVMVIMCDLCIRYTALVDNYIPNIAQCLRDKNEMVRRQTLILLTRLLQEDYVKWRGPLFFRFVESLVDPSPHVSSFANYCMMNVLQAKYGISQVGGAKKTNGEGAAQAPASNANIFYSHFVETIFVLNECRAHPSYNQASANSLIFAVKDKNGKRISNSGSNGGSSDHAFTLRGDENRSKRLEIYKIFLGNMADEHRFQLGAKLCHDVLGDIADEKIPLSECAGVLWDSLIVMASKEIKLQATKQSEGDEEISAQEQAVEEAKGRLLTKIVKKNTLENIIPVIIELKHFLEKRRSSLIRELMLYLKELYKDYKAEMNDIMSADRQLAQEIEFDLRNFNAKKIMQSPGRLSVGSNISNHSGNSNTGVPMVGNIVPTTPGKADLTNFVVPSLRTPRAMTPGRASIAGTTANSISNNNNNNSSTTPQLKPFANTPGKRLSISITPSKLQSLQSMSAQKMAIQQHLNSQSNNQTDSPIKFNLGMETTVSTTAPFASPSVPLKSAIKNRHSSNTPFKGENNQSKVIRFSLPLTDNNDQEENEEEQPTVIKMNLSIPQTQPPPARKPKIDFTIPTTTTTDENDKSKQVKPKQPLVGFVPDTKKKKNSQDSDEEPSEDELSFDESDSDSEYDSDEQPSTPIKKKKMESSTVVTKKQIPKSKKQSSANVNKKLKSTHNTSKTITSNNDTKTDSPVKKRGKKK